MNKRFASSFVILLLLSACGTNLNLFRRYSTDEFTAATKAFADDGKEYKAAGTRLAAGCQSGKINADDCVAITDDERAVRVAARKAATLLRAWAASGGRRIDKPGGYDKTAADLAAARQKVLTAELLMEVQ